MISTRWRRVQFYALFLCLLTGCGYGAAKPEDLEARDGEVVGVLVDENGKAHPDAWIQLFGVDSTEVLQSYQGIDSDGRFGVFPPKTGVYNIVGSFGAPDTATVKATAQRVEFTAGGSLNVGKIEGQKVALVTARIVDSVGTGLSDVAVRVLGSQASGTSREEGLAALAMGIPAGTYQIEFQKSGYQTLVQDLTVAAAEAKVLESVVLTAE